MTEVKKPRRRRAAPAGIAPNEPERDILDQYLYEVSTYPLLKGTEEIELAKKIRAGRFDGSCDLVHPLGILDGTRTGDHAQVAAADFDAGHLDDGGLWLGLDAGQLVRGQDRHNLGHAGNGR